MHDFAVYGKIHRPIRVAGLFSDSLYLPWRAATTAIQSDWLATDNIDRRSAEELTVPKFIQEYLLPNKPVVLTDLVTKWPAFAKWSREYLEASFGQTPAHVAGYDMPLSDFFRYSDEAIDEGPLYLFDKEFANKAPSLAADYSVPEYFEDDLFGLLGSEKRPDWRWLICGPRGSGSKFHQDPNATCAWNAVIRGSKKWVLYPPDVVPPGVHPSEDGSMVTSPSTIQEWFTGFYDQTMEGPPPVECTVQQLSLIHISEPTRLLSISYAVFCLKKKKNRKYTYHAI
eukprot:TRINITY_DN20836_c0_g1_i1.p1 TRINITY_DN20836_c0_g1~~TRINITY_DN20836_c0_g1_i1.p1  ORF type:complete len:284 (+),score=55.16 TRINITY_DN20836_c0_g1_i1:378-1229(+)